MSPFGAALNMSHTKKSGSGCRSGRSGERVLVSVVMVNTHSTFHTRCQDNSTFHTQGVLFRHFAHGHRLRHFTHALATLCTRSFDISHTGRSGFLRKFKDLADVVHSVTLPLTEYLTQRAWAVDNSGRQGCRTNHHVPRENTTDHQARALGNGFVWFSIDAFDARGTDNSMRADTESVMA